MSRSDNSIVLTAYSICDKSDVIGHTAELIGINADLIGINAYFTASIVRATATTTDFIATTRGLTPLNEEATATDGCLTSPVARPIRSLDEIDGHVARTIVLKNPLPCPPQRRA